MQSKREEMDTHPEHLCRTELLDFDSVEIRKLVEQCGWNQIKNTRARIEAVYLFVRDQIAYGYNEDFGIKASQVLQSGYGQSLTKTTLLMALLRAVGIPCRFHASTVDKIIQRGILKGTKYRLEPNHLYHGWTEISYNRQWVEIEGHIVDKPYIKKLQDLFPDYMGSFYAYGLAVLNFRNPPIAWEGNHTYVQSRAIEDDLGTFDAPDEFFAKFPEVEEYCRKLSYRKVIRPALNKNIKTIREQE